MAHGHFAGCTSTSTRECLCDMKRYGYISLIIVGILIIQIIGAEAFQSIGLYADSGHVGLDGVAALLSMYVSYRVYRGIDERRERRVRDLYLRVSAGVLCLALLLIALEAVERLNNPKEVAGLGTLLTAFVGALGNWWQHAIIERGEKHATQHAMRLHVRSDLYSSVAVILGGAGVWLTGINSIDPAASLAVVVWVGWRAIKLLLFGYQGHTH